MDMNPIVVFVQLCGVLVFAIGIYAWSHRATRGAGTFSVFMFFMAVYVLGYSMELTSPDLDGMLFWSKIEYIGTLSFPALYLLFVLDYTGEVRWLTRRNISLLFILPAVFLIVKLFDGQLRLIYSSAWVDESGIIPLLAFSKGPVYYVIASYNLLVTTVANFVLLQKRRTAALLQRRQITIILLAAGTIYLVYLYYLTGIPLVASLKHLDLNPFIYTLWGIAVALAIFRYGMFSFTPIARDTLFEILEDGVIQLDKKAVLMDANPAACKIFNWQVPPIGENAAALFGSWLDTDNLSRDCEPPVKIVTFSNDRTAGYYETKITPLKDEKGEWIGHLIILHDITFQKNIEEGLRESEEKFRRMAETSAVGIYIFDGKRYIVTNPAFTQITGYSAEELNGIDPVSLIHPQHRQMARERVAARLQGEDVPQRYEVMIVTRSGEEKWIDLSTTVITYQGKPASVGTFFDITEQKKLEESLRTSQQLYLSIVEEQTDLICRWLPDTTITFANHAYCEYFGQSKEALLGTRFIEFIPPESGEIVKNAVQSMMRDAVRTLSREDKNISPTGKERWVIWAYQPVFDVQGKLIEFQSVGRDITDRKLAEQALQKANVELAAQLARVEQLQIALLDQAVRDVLTDLFNRRYLQESLDRELARAARDQEPLSLIMLDLDRFKRLNDTYGHKAGDLVLQAVGKLLLSHTRQMDIACRFGGEEFVVILPSSPYEAALARADKLRKAVETISIEYNHSELRTTISAGVACYPQHGENGETLLHAADLALYAAKNAGRNRVMGYHEG